MRDLAQALQRLKAQAHFVFAPFIETRQNYMQNAVRVPTPYGKSLYVAQPSNAYVTVRPIPANAAVTYVGLFRANNFNATTFDSFGNNTGAVIYSQRQFSSNISPTLTVGNFSFTGNQFRLWLGCETSSVANGRANDLILNINKWYSFAAALNSSGVQYIIINGYDNDTQYNTVGAYQSAWSQSTGYIGHHNTWPSSGNDDAQVIIPFFVAFTRVLPRKLARQLSLNPFLLLNITGAKNEHIAAVLQSTYLTLSDLKAVNITSNSVQATVDYVF